ncbi:unnamed protein product, partial [Brenthis ino]
MKHYDGYYQNFSHISPVKLVSSVSDQNVYLTYVCLINEVRQLTGNDVNSPNQDRSLHVDADELIEDQPIQVERSKALHELVESQKHNDSKVEHEVQRKPNTIKFEEDLELSDSDEFDQYVNPKKLKLTKMRWLTEQREGSIDSSSPSLSPVNSSTSTCSRESDDNINHKVSFGEKCLSTILKLDREHNMFGLSNIAIVGKKTSKKMRKEDKPAFPQTAIIQICCVKGCCRHKCGGCHHCLDPCCPICVGPCGPPCKSPCGPPCRTPCRQPCDIPPCPSLVNGVDATFKLHFTKANGCPIVPPFTTVHSPVILLSVPNAMLLASSGRCSLQPSIAMFPQSTMSSTEKEK